MDKNAWFSIWTDYWFSELEKSESKNDIKKN